MLFQDHFGPGIISSLNSNVRFVASAAKIYVWELNATKLVKIAAVSGSKEPCPSWELTWLLFPPLHSYCSGLHLSIFFIYFKPQTQSLSEFSQICFIKKQPTVTINCLSIQRNYFQETGYWLEISSCECEMLLSPDENCSCSLKALLWAQQLQLLLDAPTVPCSTTGAGLGSCGREGGEGPFWKVGRPLDSKTMGKVWLWSHLFWSLSAFSVWIRGMNVAFPWSASLHQGVLWCS